MRTSEGKLVFRKAGVYTSLQDRGRFGFAEFGIPDAGCMDVYSAQLANLLLANPPENPCLEIYRGGVEMRFDKDCLVACSGARAGIQAGDKRYTTHQVISIKAGDSVSVREFSQGNWLYMAISGQFLEKEVFGSKSFYFPLTSENRFSKGDTLSYSVGNKTFGSSNCKVKPLDWNDSAKIEAYPGPEFHKLPGYVQEALLSQPFTLSQEQNRMGIHLEETVEHQLDEMLSAPVFPGTVQLTRSGKLIVLMRDAQVTGGYPRILQLTEKSVSRFAQKRPHDKVVFALVNP